jgi:hypothetical protein
MIPVWLLLPSVASVSYSWRSIFCYFHSRVSIVFLTILVLLLFTLCSISILFLMILVILLLQSVESVLYFWRSLSCYCLLWKHQYPISDDPGHAISTLLRVSIVFLKFLVLLLLHYLVSVSYSWWSLSCYLLTACSIHILFLAILILLLQHSAELLPYSWRSPFCYGLHSVASVSYSWWSLSHYCYIM